MDGVNSLRGHFHFLLATVHLLLCLGSLTSTAEDDADSPFEFLALGRGRFLVLVWRWLDGRGQGMSIHSGASSLKRVLVFFKRGATGSTPVSLLLLLLLSLGRCKLPCSQRGSRRSCRRCQLEGRAAEVPCILLLLLLPPAEAWHTVVARGSATHTTFSHGQVLTDVRVAMLRASLSEATTPILLLLLPPARLLLLLLLLLSLGMA